MGLKGNEPFQINQAFWKKNKPMTLKSTGLGAAMKEYEDAKKAAVDISKTGKASAEQRKNLPFDAALAMLSGDLKNAVDKAKGMCNKTLHKEAIAFLGRYSTVVSTEKQALGVLKLEFQNKYLENVFEPLKKQGESLLQIMVDDKEASHKEYKKAEDLKNKIDSLFKGANAMKKQPDATPADFKEMAEQGNKHLVELTKICKAIEDYDLKSQKNEPIIQSLKSSRDIFDAERNILIPLGVQARPLWSAMTMYNNKAKLFLASSEANVRELDNIVKGAATGKGVQKATSDRGALLKSVAAVAEALKGWGEDCRRQNNNMTPWQADLQKFVLAQAAAEKTKKPIEDVAKEKGIPLAPDQWKTFAKKCVADAPRFVAKSNKSKAQAIELKDKTLAKIPKDLLEDKDFKPFLTRIDNYIKEVTEYADVKNKNSFEDLQRLEKLIK